MRNDPDTAPRLPGCLCTWEEGDSACPVHPTCEECGCTACECEPLDLNGTNDFEATQP